MSPWKAASLTWSARTPTAHCPCGSSRTSRSAASARRPYLGALIAPWTDRDCHWPGACLPAMAKLGRLVRLGLIAVIPSLSSISNRAPARVDSQRKSNTPIILTLAPEPPVSPAARRNSCCAVAAEQWAAGPRLGSATPNSLRVVGLNDGFHQGRAGQPAVLPPAWKPT